MNAPDIKTPLPGPKAAAIIARDSKSVSPSYTRDYPFVMAQGEGAVVEDVDGNVFLDCAAGIAVTGTGHSHPGRRARHHRAGAASTCTCRARTSTTSRRCSWPRRWPRSCRSQRPAGPVVLRQLRRPKPSKRRSSSRGTRRKRFNIIAFLGSFHGRTLGSLAVTSSKYVQRRGFGPMMPGVFHAPYANCYRCPVGLKPEIVRRPSASASSRSRSWCTSSRPTRSPAVLVEPIQGEGGYVVPAAAVPSAAARAHAASTASCSSPTKCSPAWAARAGCSRASTSASTPTSSRSRRASRPACRSASRARART